MHAHMDTTRTQLLIAKQHPGSEGQPLKDPREEL